MFEEEIELLNVLRKTLHQIKWQMDSSRLKGHDQFLLLEHFKEISNSIADLQGFLIKKGSDE